MPRAVGATSRSDIVLVFDGEIAFKPENLEANSARREVVFSMAEYVVAAGKSTNDIDAGVGH